MKKHYDMQRASERNGSTRERSQPLYIIQTPGIFFFFKKYFCFPVTGKTHTHFEPSLISNLIAVFWKG